MINRLLSTGQIINGYLEENGKTLYDLAHNSKVSARSIYRLLNDECKLSDSVALGMNALIPEVSAEFLLSYDAKYQLQKTMFEKDNDVVDLEKHIDFFKMKKLYPEIKNDSFSLFEKAKEIFGHKNVLENKIDASSFLSYQYSQAKNQDENSALIWLVATYKEFVNLQPSGLLSFNRNTFVDAFSSLSSLCGATSIKSTIFNMRDFCETCGINFYFRPSIPNSRVKSV
ncbi:MAG: hypothetical protein RBT52_07515, partial [Sulfurimonas sp.]|nr:hypothetical protein [Sulfurimonas sp.]